MRHEEGEKASEVEPRGNEDEVKSAGSPLNPTGASRDITA